MPTKFILSFLNDLYKYIRHNNCVLFVSDLRPQNIETSEWIFDSFTVTGTDTTVNCPIRCLVGWYDTFFGSISKIVVLCYHKTTFAYVKKDFSLQMISNHRIQKIQNENRKNNLTAFLYNTTVLLLLTHMRQSSCVNSDYQSIICCYISCFVGCHHNFPNSVSRVLLMK